MLRLGELYLGFYYRLVLYNLVLYLKSLIYPRFIPYSHLSILVILSSLIYLSLSIMDLLSLLRLGTY